MMRRRRSSSPNVVTQIIRDRSRENSRVVENYDKKGRYIPHPLYKELKAKTRCDRCGKKREGKRALKIHHKVFVRDGGTNDRNNLMAVCVPCHEKLDYEYELKKQGEVS